jgi:hypothetical protein
VVHVGRAEMAAQRGLHQPAADDAIGRELRLSKPRRDFFLGQGKTHQKHAGALSVLCGRALPPIELARASVLDCGSPLPL